MAKNHTKTYPNPKNNSLQYINQKLTAAELKQFEVWVKDDQSVYEAINKMFHEGYKASVGWWSDNDVFNILIIAPNEGSINSGKALSSKSPNWFRAVAMGAYKHFIISKGDWSYFEQEDSSEG